MSVAGVLPERNGNGVEEINEDCLEEILSRLHVKDLLRFKSVSKKWNSIISSQHFIKLHLKKSISSPSHRRIFTPHPLSNVYYLHKDIKEVPPRPKEAIGYFLGASDGVVCFMDTFVDPRTFCMWNPATGVSKTVGLKLKFDHVMSWFGRESSDDEYMVVLGIKPRGKQLTSNHMQLMSLSVEDSHCGDSRYFSTQEINIDKLVFKSYEERILFHGIVHWLASRNGYSVVFTYNLGRKSVGELVMPVRSQDSTCGLGEINGCLSAVCGYLRETTSYEVWIMKEYGKKESWTKLMNIPDPGGNIQLMDLVGVGDYGDIFFRSSTWPTNVLIYNVAEKKYSTLVSNGYFIKVYVETLVFPKLSQKRTIAAPKAVGSGKKRGRDSPEE